MAELTHQDAYNVLVERVYAPVFFNKLAAETGYTPASQEEAYEMIKLASYVRNKYEMELVKEANSRVNLTSSINRSLEKLLMEEQYGAGVSADADIKQAAAQVETMPEIMAAAAKYNEYLAKQATAGN